MEKRKSRVTSAWKSGKKLSKEELRRRNVVKNREYRKRLAEERVENRRVIESQQEELQMAKNKITSLQDENKRLQQLLQECKWYKNQYRSSVMYYLAKREQCVNCKQNIPIQVISERNEDVVIKI